MNVKAYFWDLSETALKEAEKILGNPEHPKFPERMVRLLARCDKPKEIFSLISHKQFIESWPRLRKFWNQIGEAIDFRDWWETVYDQLSEEDTKVSKSLSGAPASYMESLGRMIRRARQERGWTQNDLARRSKLKQSDISAVEKGKRNITSSTQQRLSAVLRAGSSILIEGKPVTGNYDYDEKDKGYLSGFSDDGKIKWLQYRVNKMYLLPLQWIIDFDANAFNPLWQDDIDFMLGAYVVLLSGIETLGSFLIEDRKSKVENWKRFQSFIVKYAPTWTNCAEDLWKYHRCGIAHQFRIEKGSIESRLPDKKGYRRTPDGVIVNPKVLLSHVESGVARFYNDINNHGELKKKVLARFREAYPMTRPSFAAK